MEEVLISIGFDFNTCSLFECWELNKIISMWYIIQQVVALGGLESGGTDERASEGELVEKRKMSRKNLEFLCFERYRKPPGTLGGRRSWVWFEEPLLCGLSQVNEYLTNYNQNVDKNNCQRSSSLFQPFQPVHSMSVWCALFSNPHTQWVLPTAYGQYQRHNIEIPH